jgi:hypothetical protein
MMAAAPGTASAETWFPAAPMSQVRAEQTATLLPDGDVLVAGGYANRLGYLNTAEVFDQTTGTWTPAAPMNAPRSGHRATLLPNGKVLVVGGDPPAEDPGESAETYDPSTNTWTAVASPPGLQVLRSLTLLQDGEVLVTGIFGPREYGALEGAMVYDPSTNTWTSAAAPKQTRYGATTTLFTNGDVLVLGGARPSEHLFEFHNTLNVAEEYDPTTNTWTTLAQMLHARHHQTATLLPSGKVLVAGGAEETDLNDHGINSSELYDPATNTWTAGAPMLSGRVNQTATLLPSGDVLVVGGWGDFEPSSPTELLSCPVWGCQGAYSAELYDPATNAWTPTVPLTTGSHHTATLLAYGAVLVAGGLLEPLGSKELDTAEIYASRYPPDEPPAALSPQAATAQPPILTDVTQSHRVWREGNTRASFARAHRLPPLGTTFSFTLNEQVGVSLAFAQRQQGRSVKGDCVAQTKRNRHRHACMHALPRGGLSFTGHAGKNEVSFQGRISRSQKLAPGSFTLLITATNAAGHTTGGELRFTIVK